MPDSPGLIDIYEKLIKEAEEIQSRLSAEAQVLAFRTKTPEQRALEVVPGAPQCKSPTSDLGESLQIPPFERIEHIDSNKNQSWKAPDSYKDTDNTTTYGGQARGNQENPYNFEKMLAEATRRANERPFATLDPPLLVSAGLCPYIVGLSTPGLLGSMNRGLGGGVVASFGAVQGYKDYQNLLNAHDNIGQLKYRMALGFDSSMVFGGLTSMTKFSPKWLSATLLFGGVAGRMALDLLPNRR